MTIDIFYVKRCYAPSLKKWIWYFHNKETYGIAIRILGLYFNFRNSKLREYINKQLPVNQCMVNV